MDRGFRPEKHQEVKPPEVQHQLRERARRSFIETIYSRECPDNQGVTNAVQRLLRASLDAPSDKIRAIGDFICDKNSINNFMPPDKREEARLRLRILTCVELVANPNTKLKEAERHQVLMETAMAIYTSLLPREYLELSGAESPENLEASAAAWHMTHNVLRQGFEFRQAILVRMLDKQGLPDEDKERIETALQFIDDAIFQQSSRIDLDEGDA